MIGAGTLMPEAIINDFVKHNDLKRQGEKEVNRNRKRGEKREQEEKK